MLLLKGSLMHRALNTPYVTDEINTTTLFFLFLGGPKIAKIRFLRIQIDKTSQPHFSAGLQAGLTRATWNKLLTSGALAWAAVANRRAHNERAASGNTT
jgi:hypothetical protein